MIQSSNSLKRYRQFTGYTQKEIYQDLNMPFSSYQQKEQGRISFSAYEMSEIRDLLAKRLGKISIDSIFLNKKYK